MLTRDELRTIARARNAHQGGRGANDSGSAVSYVGSIATIVDRLRILEGELSGEKGDFSLFALLLREGSPDRWDWAVAAPWLTDRRNSLEFLSERLSHALTRQQLLMISRIVLLGAKDQFLRAIHQAVTVDHGLVEISSRQFEGVEIAHGFIITSRIDA